MGTVRLRRRADRRQRDRCRRPWHRRGAAPGAERRRDADFVSGADRAGQCAAGHRRGCTCRLAGLSLQQIFGWVFAPVAWSMGVPWRDAPTVGNLLGTRMVLNEFVAYSQLGPLKATLDPKSFTICHVRAVRLRQFQLDRHPDRRHRRAGAESPPRSRAARPARDVRRHAREFHDGNDRRLSVVSDCR